MSEGGKVITIPAQRNLLRGRSLPLTDLKSARKPVARSDIKEGCTDEGLVGEKVYPRVYLFFVL